MKHYKIAGDETEYNSLWELKQEHRDLIFPMDLTDDELKDLMNITIIEIPDPVPVQSPEIAAKSERYLKINEITVTVDDMVFEANENSQQRIALALAVMSEGDTREWILKDNTCVTVTYSQLKQVLTLAQAAFQEIWTSPYTISE